MYFQRHACGQTNTHRHMSDMIITILRSSIGGRVKNNDQELKTKNKGATKYMFMLKATVKKVKK